MFGKVFVCFVCVVVECVCCVFCGFGGFVGGGFCGGCGVVDCVFYIVCYYVFFLILCLGIGIGVFDVGCIWVQSLVISMGKNFDIVFDICNI